ncbi:MAG: zinc-dependent alcohol dehydrogenase family protein [Betaproteobacteria bacterium]|nr:zinc-dependent alcohol dehydrogenase family protein [Betaproteobacteria bacterium]MDH5222071.1 zinc-dependent alcohol dehydrogenase family protein [Betaproteobacteria bacterium]MDH5351648.1 zinc-dependent alcohol dehydrogenase family protein [Betaproteobacteria bacterium]
MLVAQVNAFGRPEAAIELVEQPDPGEPGAEEVTIDAEFAPINPADLLNLEGKYGAAPPRLPMIPGAEGVGRIAKIGAAVRHVTPGDRVLLPGPGCWRQRFKAPGKAVFALPQGVDPKQLAMLRVNPPTAHLMLHQFVAPELGRWVIQNAANSGVGHCLIRLARLAGVKSVNVVRREGLVAPLRALGGDVVLTDGPDLDARVRAAIGDAALPLAIDAVGGSGTQRLARCVSDGGIVVNYGMLSGEPCMVDGRETVFRDVRLQGFWLRKWFADTPPAQIAALYRDLAARVADGTLAVEVEAVYSIHKIKEAVAHAARGGRSGKILLSFAQQ